MSIDTSSQFHFQFLSRYFNLPEAERTSPFMPAGVRGAISFAEGFPDEALVDHRFTPPEDSVPALIALMDACLTRGLKTGWLDAFKRPVTSQKQCGHKQGLCTDRDFLVNTYNSLKNRELDRRPQFLAFPTNANSAPFVIDLDFKAGVKDACQTFFLFLEENGIDPGTFTCVMTPSGGVHLYFLSYMGEHSSWVNFASEVFGPGVDIRGNGALALLAGSFATMPDGTFKQYHVLNNAPLSPVPDCVADVIERHAQNKRAMSVVPVDCEFKFDSQSEIDAACRIMMSKEEGERHTTLNNMSFAMGKLIRDGKLSEDETRGKLMQAAIHTGLTESEVMTTIESGIKDGQASQETYAPFNGGTDAQLIPDDPKDGAQTDEAFLAEKELADFTYTKGFLGRFAERKGCLTDEKVDERAKFAFPEKIYRVARNIHESFSLDWTSVVQAISALSCLILKGARVAVLDEETIRKSYPDANDGQTIPANVFVLTIGAPSSGKTLLGSLLLSHVAHKQEDEFRRYAAEYEEYKKKKAEYEKNKKKPDAVEPIKPTYYCFYTNDTTMEAAVHRAQGNPGGILCHMDEGAGQSTLGADRYNNKGADNARAKLIAGYQGHTVSTERKNHEKELGSECVRSFNLSVWFNVQDSKIAATFNSGDDDQGYMQRFTPIIMPAKPEGERGCPVRTADHTDQADLGFLHATIDKLLDLRVVPEKVESDNPEDKTPPRLVAPKLYFSAGAYEVYDSWTRSFTRSCNYGRSMQVIVSRFLELVVKLALGFHYLHLAAECAEKKLDIMETDQEREQRIEQIDMERAIMVSDLFLKKLDEFLWLRDKPAWDSKKRLTRDEEALSKHVMANHAFYRKPRSVKEIIEKGFITKMTPKELYAWLKKEGFAVVKSGGPNSHRERKFDLEGLKPWAGAIDLSRLVFSENQAVPVARTIFKIWELIKICEFKMSVSEFSEYLGYGDESAKLIRALVADRQFMVDEYQGNLLFRPETIDVVTRILAEEGLIIDGKLVSEAV